MGLPQPIVHHSASPGVGFLGMHVRRARRSTRLALNGSGGSSQVDTWLYIQVYSCMHEPLLVIKCPT